MRMVVENLLDAHAQLLLFEIPNIWLYTQQYLFSFLAKILIFYYYNCPLVLLSPFCGITKEIMSRGPQVVDMECRETT
jgi:hypothetical protein